MNKKLKTIFTLLLIMLFISNYFNPVTSKEIKTNLASKYEIMEDGTCSYKARSGYNSTPFTSNQDGVKRKCAVILSSSEDSYFIENGHEVRDICKNRGYNILCIDGASTTEKVYSDIKSFLDTSLGQNKQLLFFIGGHGGYCPTLKRSLVTLSEGYDAKIYSDDFGSFLDQYSSIYSACTVIVSSCQCGGFIDGLSGENRIIMTSTDKTHLTYCVGGGRYCAFSHELFELYSEGKNWKECWEEGDLAVYCRDYDQNPLFDDNGNGHGVGNINVKDTLPMDDGHTPVGEPIDGEFAVTVHNNLPPNKPAEPEPKNGFIKKGRVSRVYPFYVITQDSELDPVSYLVDWGDGTDSGWTELYGQGQKITLNHSWDSEGTYEIKVIAIDDPNRDGNFSDGDLSLWSDSFSFEIKKSFSKQKNIISRFLTRLSELISCKNNLFSKL